MYRINNILPLLIIITLFMPVVSNARDLGQDDKLNEFKHKLLDLKKEKSCREMEQIFSDLTINYRDSELVPIWSYEVIQCFGKNTGTLGLEIDQYYLRRVLRLIKAGECVNAEKTVREIEKKYIPYIYQLSYLELQVAQCFEDTDKPRSIKLYREIDQKYSGKETSIIAQQKLKKLLLKHTWFYKRPDKIINQVRAAIVETDVERLLSVASKSDFSIGFEEERINLARSERETKKILIEVFGKSKPLLGNFSYKGKNIKLLLVVFPSEDYPFWYFQFKKEEEGWHWTGIIVSNIKNSSTVKNFGELDLVPRYRKK